MSRFTRALAAAVILHGIAIVAARSVRPASRPPAPVAELEIAIEPPAPDTEPVAPQPPAPPVVPENEPPPPVTATRVASAEPRTRPTNDVPPPTEILAVPVPSGTPAAVPPGVPGNDTNNGWTVSPLAARGVDLGLHGTAKYGQPSAAPSADVGSPGLRRGTFDDPSEVGRGFARGGAAVGVAESETRASLAPVDGWAILDVFADATGHVTKVEVIEVSDDRPSWEEMAKSMLGAMHGKVARIRQGASGLVTRLRVESKWQHPDGRSASHGPSIGEVLSNPLNMAMQAVDPSESKAGIRVVRATILGEQTIWM